MHITFKDEVGSMKTKSTINIPEELSPFIPQFLERRRFDVKKLVELIDEKRFYEIAEMGHNLKGHSASYGFFGLTEIAENLEKYSEQKDAASLRNTQKQFAEYMEKAILEIEG